MALLGTAPHLANALERLPPPRPPHCTLAQIYPSPGLHPHPHTRRKHTPPPRPVGSNSVALLLALHPSGVLCPPFASAAYPARRRLAPRRSYRSRIVHRPQPTHPHRATHLGRDPRLRLHRRNHR